ncbi:MAG: ABC transporter substrate-binding protein [bacterium]
MIGYTGYFEKDVLAKGPYIFEVKLLFLPVILLLILGCSSEPLTGAGWIRIGIESNPTNLDPRLAMDAVSSSIAQLLYNGLFRLDENSGFVPDLARSWENPDSLTYKISLRPGVLFHDLTPLTAEDVKYTYESILSPEFKSPKAGALADLKEVVVAPSGEIIFRLKRPNAAFLSNLCIGIVSSRSRERKGLPSGTGPFTFTSGKADQYVKLAAFKRYFKGSPKLKGVLFKVVPENMVRVLQLERGEIDLIQNPIPPDMLERLNSNHSLTVMINTGTTFAYLGFNFQDKYLSRKEVRRAIACGIDRKAIIKHILKGLATAADSLLPGNHWAYAGNLPRIDYQPKLSKELLDQAGFPDPDGEGPRCRFKLTYKTSQNEESRLIAEVIQSQLARIGIEVKIESYEWGTFFSDIKKGNFQLYSLKWVGITDPDIYYYIFHSRSRPPVGANRGRYQNPRLDRLLEKGRATTGPEKRKRIYAQVQTILAEELPYVNLWHQTNITVIQNKIKGFEQFPSGGLQSLGKVSLDGS